jgi:hypothetical protein
MKLLIVDVPCVYNVPWFLNEKKRNSQTNISKQLAERIQQVIDGIMNRCDLYPFTDWVDYSYNQSFAS